MGSPALKTLEQVTERLIDYRGKTPPKTDAGVRLITAKVIKRGQILPEPAEYIAANFYDEWMRRGLPQDLDVLITTEAPLGEVALLRLREPVALAQRVILLRANRGLVDPVYLFYSLQSDVARAELHARASGTTVSGIKQSELRKVRVPVPALSEQRRIASVLSAYDILIENCEGRIRLLDKMARALYREWFVLCQYPGHEKTRLVASPLGSIPKGWSIRRVKDVATVVYGFPFKSALFSNDSSAGLPVVRIRDIPEGASDTYTTEAVHSRYEIKNGDILVGMDGDFHMAIWSNGRALQNQRVARFQPASGWSALHFLLALEGPVQALNKAIVGTTVAHLGDMHIRDIRLVEPSADVLERAKDMFGAMGSEAAKLQQQVRSLRATRDLLLPRLLSGQLPAVEAA